VNGDGNGNGNTLLDYINSLGRTAGTVYSTLHPPDKVAPAPGPGPAMNWTPWAIGGGVVFLVIVLAMFAGGRK